MRRIAWLDIITLVVVLMVGAARLPTPFAGDQALNLLMGKVIYQGGSPYRDLWDLKHPGVFFFFRAGGALFGFDEIGIHLFELLWMMALALLVRVAAGRWLEERAIASLAPALTVGLYYAVAGERYLTQTESLVGAPMLISLWCAVEALKAERRMKLWLVTSGLAAGVVMVFKIPYVAIPAVFWVLGVRELTVRGERLWRSVTLVAPWVIAGAFLPLVATGIYLAQKDAAGLFFWTCFRHPVEVSAVMPLEPRRLVRAARWFVDSFAPVLVLAGIGIGAALRKRMDLMTAGLCAWLSVGSLLIAMQVISWWNYHFVLLLVPSGLLAARGLEAARKVLTSWVRPSQLRLARLVGALALVLLFAPQLSSAARVVSDTWRSRPLPYSTQGIAAYQAAHYRDYASIRARTAFLRDPGSQPGPIYVIDTPIYYFQACRLPAMPLLAPWFYPTDRLWKQFFTELKATQAPYVRVSDAALEAMINYRPALRNDVAGIVPLIESRYDAFARDDEGTWYVRRDLAAGR
jgi:hypothetical protein